MKSDLPNLLLWPHRMVFVVTVLLSTTWAGAGDQTALRDAAQRRRENHTPEVVTVLPDHVEIDLGEYDVPVYQLESNTTITVYCHLFCTVRSSDSHRFNGQLERLEHRMRDRLMVAIRSTTREELYEAELTRFKARLLKALRARIDDPKVFQVGFFSLMYNEQ